MLTFYQSLPAIIGWQVVNQSFNGIVNYTNRSGDAPIAASTLATSFGIATTSATAAAVFFNRVAKCMPPFFARIVPFTAVATANCINLPFMRSSELKNGIQLVNDKNEKIAQSPQVAKKAISQVSFELELLLYLRGCNKSINSFQLKGCCF